MINHKSERKLHNYTILILVMLPLPIIFYLDSNEILMDWMNEHFLISIISILFFIHVINLFMEKWNWRIINKSLVDNDEVKFKAYLESSKDRRTLKEKILSKKKPLMSLLFILWSLTYWFVAIGITVLLPLFLVTENHLPMYMFIVGWIILTIVFIYPLGKIDTYVKAKLE